MSRSRRDRLVGSSVWWCGGECASISGVVDRGTAAAVAMAADTAPAPAWPPPPRHPPEGVA